MKNYPNVYPEINNLALLSIVSEVLKELTNENRIGLLTKTKLNGFFDFIPHCKLNKI